MVWELKEKVNNLVMPFIMKPWAVTPEKLTKLIFSKERQPRFKKKKRQFIAQCFTTSATIYCNFQNV